MLIFWSNMKNWNVQIMIYGWKFLYFKTKINWFKPDKKIANTYVFRIHTCMIILRLWIHIHILDAKSWYGLKIMSVVFYHVSRFRLCSYTNLWQFNSPVCTLSQQKLRKKCWQNISEVKNFLFELVVKCKECIQHNYTYIIVVGMYYGLKYLNSKVLRRVFFITSYR